MKDKILALLIDKFTGVRKDGLNYFAGAIALQVDTEEQATEIVGKLTAEKVNQFITDWRKDADAEISKSNKTYEDNLKKKFDFIEKKAPPKLKDEEKIDGEISAAAIQKIISEAIKPLSVKLQKFEDQSVINTRLQTLGEKLKECKDENLVNMVNKNFARMNFENDEQFNEYLSEIETDIKNANQTTADKGLGSFGKPFTPSGKNTGETEATKAEIDEVMSRLII